MASFYFSNSILELEVSVKDGLLQMEKNETLTSVH